MEGFIVKDQTFRTNLCDLCGEQKHTPQRTLRAQSIQDIYQRYKVPGYNSTLQMDRR
jgi:hypothetical protein